MHAQLHCAGNWLCGCATAASAIDPQELPVRIVELHRDQSVELPGEDAQADVAARIFLVEPPDQNHVGDGGNVPPPIALLLDRAQRLVALEDRLHVLHGLRDDHALALVECEARLHHAISATDRVAVGDVPVRTPAIFCPGVTVKYSGVLSAIAASVAVAVGVPSPIRMRADVTVPPALKTTTRTW